MAYVRNYLAQPTYVPFFKRRRLNFPYIYKLKRQFFLQKLPTYYVRSFKKLDPPMYAHFVFQNPPWLDYHGKILLEYPPLPLPPSAPKVFGHLQHHSTPKHS